MREDDGGLGLDSLPPGVRRYEDQILDVARRPPAARRARAYRALRAGNAPAAEVPNLLNAAAAEHGALAVCAALVVTDNDAEARYCPQRLAFFEAVLGDIAAHRRRSAMPAKAAPPKGRRAAPPVDGDLTPEDVAWHVAHSGLSAADFYKAGTDRRTGDPIHRLRPEARARVTS